MKDTVACVVTANANFELHPTHDVASGVGTALRRKFHAASTTHSISCSVNNTFNFVQYQQHIQFRAVSTKHLISNQ